MGKLKVNQYVVGPVQTNCYFAINDETKEVLIIDPGANPKQLAERISTEGVKPVAILLTHGHFDHIYSVDYVREKYNCQLCIHENDALCLTDSYKNANKLFFNEDLTFNPADWLISDKDKLSLGELQIKVIHTPGHTEGCVCYLVENALICGDTIFDRSVGRTDLPSGNTKVLYESLRKIKTMDESIRLYPGHGSITTIKEQKQSNPYLKGL